MTGGTVMNPVSVPTVGGGGGGGGGAEEQTANMVRIFESSILGVDKLSLDRTGADETSETQLDLRAGQIMSNTKKLSALSRYEIKIPNGVAGIRGNCSLLSSSANCASIIGTVALALVQPDGSVKPYEVTGKHWFDPVTGLITLIPDDKFKEYLKLYDSLRGFFHLPPLEFLKDITKIGCSDVDGTPGKR